MPASVLTQHNDNFRSGANLQETKLNTTNVNVNDFGLLASREVAGRIYAQPLYVTGVVIDGKPRNVVYVATMHNWVYAFDADDLSPGAAPLWKRQVDSHPVPSHFYGQGYVDISNNNDDPIGILSTPGIDLAAHTIYLVAAAFDPAILTGSGTTAQNAFKQLLFALDLSTGNLRAPAAGSSNPVPITGSVSGVGYRDGKELGQPPIQVTRTANGASVEVTVHGAKMTVVDADNGRVFFSPMQHMQRPGLLLQNGLLYIAFGSHGDFAPYHGWVFAYEAASLKQRGIFCCTPGGAAGGIWQAGEGPVGDANGNIYFGSGNGDSNPTAVGGPNLGESFIRLRATATSLELDAYRTIFQDAGNVVFDEDLGAASPTILPDGFLVGGGKDGNFYLLDPAQMTKTGAAAALVQAFLATRGRGSRAEVFVNGKSISTHHIHGSPVVYDSPNQGVLVYVWGENELLRAFTYDPSTHRFPGQPNARNAQGQSTAIGSMYASNDERNRDGMPGAMLSLSADGKKPGTAILWASLPPFGNANHGSVDGVLTAYDATRFDSQGRLVQLWHSHQNPNDDPGIFAKFCCPTVADGKVFLATFSNKLQIYGLRSVSDGGYSVGFGGHNGLSLNGSARSAGGPLRLTGQHDFQAGSVFCSKPVNVKTFNSTFRFRTTPGNGTADGFTFCIQAEGPHALGGPGGGLGYGPDPNNPNDPGFKITHSVALKFDLFDNQNIQASSSLGLYKNGDMPTAANAIGGEIQIAQLGMDLHSGHQFVTTLSYDGATLRVILKDLTLRTQIARSLPIDIPSITGSPAHVGFSAGTGLSSADQEILSWQYNS